MSIESNLTRKDLAEFLRDQQWPLLKAVAVLANAPLTEIAERLRDALNPYMTSNALVIFTEDCTGRPQKKTGEEEITSRVSIAELETLRCYLTDDGPYLGEAELAGRTRSVLALKHTSSNALLVLTNPQAVASGNDTVLDMVLYLWGITARRIQEKVTDAPPSYLLESRAASAERIRVTAELTDLHSVTLVTLLAALRSTSLDDAAARTTVTDLTANALIKLRALSNRTKDLVEEPVAKAFERLQDDLRPLLCFRGIEVQYIAPPLNGRAIPGEVAHAARGTVRGLVLTRVDQTGVSRIRIQWDCDGVNLLISVRDDGDSSAIDARSIIGLERRVKALMGQLRMDVMPGWGADISASIPLDPPSPPAGDIAGWNLAVRELEVLELLVAGQRNRNIATTLGITENTAKFHIRNLFSKLNVQSRSEAIALVNSKIRR
jgi:DNA-binding CsgD family transcriptional regulator